MAKKANILIKHNDRLIPFDNETSVFVSKLEEGDKVLCEKVKKTRSSQQNRALHLFFKMIAENLNKEGITFVYRGLKGQELETQYTEHLVKEMIWRPIQVTLFKVESTTKLDTTMINKILDVLVNFFANKGVQISFPSRFDLMVKEMEENGYY